MKIIDINPIQILDSRGNPTVEVSILLDDGSKGVFAVPSGASTGIHEAHELRDEVENYYHGKSVEKAIENINKIKKDLYRKEFSQRTFDQKIIELDATENKSNLGANAMLGLSVAFAKASALYYNLPLHEYLNRFANEINFKNKKFSEKSEVHLFANVINGGLHAGNGLNIQEFMLVPTFGTLQDKVRAISEIYQDLKQIISKKYGKQNTSVGDEGGFAPNIQKTKEALDLLMKAIKHSDYEGKISLAMDAAASDFYDEKTKKYTVEKGSKFDYKQLTDFYNELIAQYPIISIEDPMAEDDFEGFEYFRKNVDKLSLKNPLTDKKDILIVGDDLLVTNPQRIKLAKKKKLCNSLLLKVNQIGTLSESVDAHLLARDSKWHTIVSHRSGETTDSFIADLSVALASSIKIGAPARGERTAKYNRLLEIYQ